MLNILFLITADSRDGISVPGENLSSAIGKQKTTVCDKTVCDEPTSGSCILEVSEEEMNESDSENGYSSPADKIIIANSKRWKPETESYGGTLLDEDNIIIDKERCEVGNESYDSTLLDEDDVIYVYNKQRKIRIESKDSTLLDEDDVMINNKRRKIATESENFAFMDENDVCDIISDERKRPKRETRRENMVNSSEMIDDLDVSLKMQYGITASRSPEVDVMLEQVELDDIIEDEINQFYMSGKLSLTTEEDVELTDCSNISQRGGVFPHHNTEHEVCDLETNQLGAAQKQLDGVLELDIEVKNEEPDISTSSDSISIVPISVVQNVDEASQ